MTFFHIHAVSAGAVYAAVIAKYFPESMIGNVVISCPPVDPSAPGMQELGYHYALNRLHIVWYDCALSW